MNPFGTELAQIRKIANLSQYQLAKEMEISRSYIFRLESGERKPNKELIIKISEILKISNYDLTKLFVLADIEPVIENNNDGFKLAFHLALELKNKGLIEQAKYIIDLAMSIFDNTIELNALSANLNLLNNDYDQAIKDNEEALKNLEKLPKSQINKIGISKAEIIHNTGYVYFERGLEKNDHRDKAITQNWKTNDKEIGGFIEELKNEIIVDFDKALEKIETAYNLELDNLHIVDQLARLYYHKANLFDEEVQREILFNKSISLYEIIIGSVSNKIEDFKKQEASIFIAVALGKIFKLDEASRIINTVINYKPLYYFGYFAKSCIYAINCKNNEELLEISFNSLLKSLKLNSALKDYLKLEVDLYNLRFSKIFEDRFNDLYLIQEE